MKNRTKSRAFKIASIAIISSVAYLVQVYLYPNSGNRLTDNSYIYTFQMNYWNTQINRGIQNIRESGTYERLSLSTGSKKVDEKYFITLNKYKNQLVELYRYTHFFGVAVSNIQSDLTEEVLRVVFAKMSSSKVDDIQKSYKFFLKVVERYSEQKDAFKKTLLELNQTIKTLNANKTDAEKHIALITFLKKIYSDNALFLRYRTSDNFNNVSSLILASQPLLYNYKQIINTYNKARESEESCKNAILLFLILLGAFISFLKEREDIYLDQEKP